MLDTLQLERVKKQRYIHAAHFKFSLETIVEAWCSNNGLMAYCYLELQDE